MEEAEEANSSNADDFHLSAFLLFHVHMITLVYQYHNSNPYQVHFLTFISCTCSHALYNNHSNLPILIQCEGAQKGPQNIFRAPGGPIHLWFGSLEPQNLKFWGPIFTWHLDDEGCIMKSNILLGWIEWMNTSLVPRPSCCTSLTPPALAKMGGGLG